MRSYVSHFSAIILATGLAAACAKGEERVSVDSVKEILLVSSEEYREKACWIHSDGSFQAFLVLARNGNYAVPDFVSVNCLIKGDYGSYGEATILHIGTIRMLDTNGKLQDKFPSLHIAGNVASDQPFPSGNSKVYYFKARLKRTTHPYQIVYAPHKIEMLIDINTSFVELLESTSAERKKLLQSLQ